MLRPPTLPRRSLPWLVLALVLSGCAARGGPAQDVAGWQEALDRSLPIADTARRTGQPAAAGRIYRALADQVDAAPEPRLGLARLHLDAGEWRDALRRFEEAEIRASARPALAAEARLGQARVHVLRARDWAGARRILSGRPDLLRDPSLPSDVAAASWALLSLAREQLGDPEGALAALHAALAAAPSDPALWANEVVLHLRLGDPAEAARRLDARPASGWLPGDLERLRLLVGPPDPVATPLPLPAVRLDPLEPIPLPGDPSLAGAPAGSLLGLLPPVVGPGVAPVPPPPFELVLGEARSVVLPEPASSVVVVREQVADVHLASPTSLYVLARGPGRTQIAIELATGERMHTTLTVVQDPQPIQSVLDGLPEASGIRAVGLPYAVSLRGSVPSPEAAEWILGRVAGAVPEGVALDNGIQVAGPLQVELEVQIAEVQRNVTEQLGLEWSVYRSPEIIDGVRQLPFPPPRTGLSAGLQEPALRVGALGRLGAYDLEVMIHALAGAGLASVLAQPTLTALSGEEATFHAGGEIPVLSGEKDDRLEYTYRELGVVLGFVPTVISPDRIGISVRAEVKEQDESRGADVRLPLLTARKASTTVEVADGESFVIAGLFSTGAERSESGVPGLKDVPGLGLLFGKTLATADEHELIITVTARLVDPVAAPADGGGAVLPSSVLVDGYYL